MKKLTALLAAGFADMAFLFILREYDIRVVGLGGYILNWIFYAIIYFVFYEMIGKSNKENK